MKSRVYISQEEDDGICYSIRTYNPTSGQDFGYSMHYDPCRGSTSRTSNGSSTSRSS